ncbi:MAG: methyltransferase domain-containing protein [Candidatus Heimdallarchaeota archaeon]|nr:methyltransferase domain-containing protein [Candidatus Heimdallarchaeota archaeon]
MNTVLLIILIILGIPVLLLLNLITVVKLVRKIYPFPIPQFMTEFIDNPVRRKYWQKPDQIAQRTGAFPGAVVVEVGPGKGSYTKAVAKRIGSEGIVYAIDIQQSILDRLQERLDKAEIKNIIPKLDDAYDLDFENNSVDIIFAITCLPEIPEPVKVLKEFRRILKPGGTISFCELFLDPDYPFRRTEKKWAFEAGLVLKEEFGNWFSYQLNFSKE